MAAAQAARSSGSTSAWPVSSRASSGGHGQMAAATITAVLAARPR